MKILLDTSFILTCVKQKIDFIELADKLFSEKIEFLVPLEVLHELEIVSKKKNKSKKDRQAAQLALEILQKKEIKKIKLNKEVDKGILDYAEKNKVMVATLDKELKKALSSKNTEILIIRHKKTISLI